MPYSHPHTVRGQNPYTLLVNPANSNGCGHSTTPTTMKALSPHLCAEPPSSTWVMMMLWGDRFDPLPPVIWIPSPSVPFRMCIFHMRQPSR